MSTKLIWFQYHTTAVGNKSSSIFLIESRNVFGGMGAALIRWCFRPFSVSVIRGALAADDAGRR